MHKWPDSGAAAMQESRNRYRSSPNPDSDTTDVGFNSHLCQSMYTVVAASEAECQPLDVGWTLRTLTKFGEKGPFQPVMSTKS